MELDKDYLMAKVAFFRGADFSKSIGVTDWRVGLYLPEYGHKTFIYGKGNVKSHFQTQAILISKPYVHIPILGGILLALTYVPDALKKEVDVVVCNVGVYLGGVILKIINPKIKLILDIRSIPVETKGLIGFLEELYFCLCVKSKYFDALSIISQGMLSDIINKYSFKIKTNVVVWDSGYDENVFKPIESKKIKYIKDKFILIFHGSFNVHRGLFETVRAIKILSERGIKEIQLILIGGGKAKIELEDLVVKLNIQENVIFIPRINYEELPEYLARADLGINLPPDLSWWRHQSYLKVMEYIAMGLPVLATDLPCHRNISDAIILISDNNPPTIAKAILDYKNFSVENKHKLRLTAIIDSKKHTWRAKAKILADFIDSEIRNNLPVNNSK
jgi:glycosyltransferase involved in cell wall biosynthesis